MTKDSLRFCSSCCQLVLYLLFLNATNVQVGTYQREEDCAVWLSSIVTWTCGACTPDQIDGKNIYTHSPWQTAAQPPAVVRIYPARRHGAARGGTWWMHGPARYLHMVASLRGGA
ncbi:uncharacterized protein IWZ02DRAFT_434323 [Phyllosticta citriasiana]|uniref:uncharacterized protein n=1 Tax=Phyllosticta citriasiana TaxID=595635 RepID=UPI0030FD34F7